MPVERSDANTGAFGDSVSRRLAADLQNQLDGDLDEALPVLSRVSPHCAPAAGFSPISLTWS